MLIGLDLGEKRVGVALCDEQTGIATPLKTVTFHSRKKMAEELGKLVEEYQASKIVVGLPRTLKGEIGPAAQKVIDWVEDLKSKIGCSWVFWDERLSSQEVERVLLAADVSREKRKLVRDQLAAQRILQSYVDAQDKN
ncbi:MAG TPA: Holliday junction resolvase RuvX [bacterium]|nr:Holliday junction resolvase RuvX [bacterium]